MFESISEKFNQTFKKLTNKGVLNEKNIAASLKDVKMALLEADVNYRVVSSFLRAVKKRALGTEVIGSLTPGQQFIRVVNEELIAMMGSENSELASESNGMTVIMMVGLQGSGKTTSAAKIARRLKKNGKSVYLVPADVYRPAAIDQLQTLAKSLKVSCYPTQSGDKPAEIVKDAKLKAEAEFADYMIVDTAGRLHIDEDLMEELEQIKSNIPVHEILFVADAMTGQEAVNVAKTFHDKLNVTGFVLTKMDGDARGGAALSIRAITGQPVKFVGMGEKIEALDPFYPDRIASKILGMGDLLSLIEKAQENFDEKKAKDLEKKIRKNSFTLNDFYEQLQQIKKMGSLSDLVSMLPGVGNKLPANAQVDDKALVQLEAIISSMTQEEKENPSIINGSRKLRISKGCGREVSEINRLLKQFAQMKKMMKKFSSAKGRKQLKAMQNMMGGGGTGMPPGMF